MKKELVATEKEIQCPDSSKLEDKSFIEILEELETSSRFHKTFDNTTVHLNIKEKTNDLVIKGFIADGHIGSKGTDYVEFKKTVRLFQENSFVGVTLLGDMYDNYLHFPSLRGANDAIIGPSIQMECVARFVEELEESKQLDCVVLGNHEIDREERAVGYSVLKKRLPKEIAKKVMEGMGVMQLDIGKQSNRMQSYKIFLGHKGKGNSIYNPLHAAMRIARLENHPDTVVLAHTHNPALIDYYEGGKQIICARCGTFKTKDSYSERYFDIRSGQIAVPTIIYFHSEKKMMGFLNPQTAIKVYKAEMGLK